MYIFFNIYLYEIFFFYPVQILYMIIVRDGKAKKKNAIKRAFAGK